MFNVKVRYNTTVSDDHLYWRVLINGVEHLASEVIFEVPTYTTKDEIEGVGTKHHISCYAEEIIWDEETQKVTIK